jgi:hypothetical protein
MADGMLSGAEIGAGFGGNFHTGWGRESGGDAWKQVEHGFLSVKESFELQGLNNLAIGFLIRSTVDGHPALSTSQTKCLWPRGSLSLNVAFSLVVVFQSGMDLYCTRPFFCFFLALPVDVLLFV